MSADEEALDRVREYRRAARMAVEADVEWTTKALALLDVADMARREPDPVTRLWCERVIWAEAEPFLFDEPIDRTVGDAWERAQRKMRAAGYEACPRCRGRIATQDELEQMALRREQRIRDLEVRQRAVDR